MKSAVKPEKIYGENKNLQSLGSKIKCLLNTELTSFVSLNDLLIREIFRESRCAQMETVDLMISLTSLSLMLLHKKLPNLENTQDLD